MKVRIFIYIVFMFSLLNCKAQNKFHKHKFKIKKENVKYISKIPEIELEILDKKKVYKCKVLKGDSYTNYLLGSLNDSFKTKAFSEIIEINQIGFALGNEYIKEENIEEKRYGDDIFIQEWVFKNNKEAVNTFNHLQKIKPGIILYYKFSIEWNWLIKDNIIYFINSDYYDNESKEFNDIFEIVKGTIFD